MEKATMKPPTLSVSECIAAVNQTLEFAYSQVVVEGEVANYTVNQGKFVFFDIKDDQGTLQCFSMLWQMKTPLENGMRVAVQSIPKLTQKGRFSLTAQAVRPIGEGSIGRSFELLRSKLEKEGLFATERKRPIPRIPQRIGVISSTDAAGYGDFVTIINQRWGGLIVDVAHVQVQGVGSEKQVINALEFLNQREPGYDAIVIVRGGGSTDDLQTFNDETLVRAIATSRTPVMTGIGHEQDVTLADLVSDERASTPSNAAERIVPDRHEEVRATRSTVLQMSRRARQALSDMRQSVHDELGVALRKTTDRIESILEDHRRMMNLLAAYDPMQVLRRGYAFVRGAIAVGRHIEIDTANNTIKAEVVDVKKR